MAEDAVLDLSEPRAVHVIGIGGAGMGAIATVLTSMGHRVTGSDLKESPGLERLRALGVGIAIGHDAENVGDVDVVAISTAVPDRNPEVRAALEREIPVLRRAEVLAAITRTRRTVAVAGTHGKTTTSSMLALVLVEAGLRPSFIIGGDVNEIGTGAVLDDGDWLVVEADESDGTFIELDREAVIVTSVEPDHLEHHGSVESLGEAFREFVVGATGPCVLCADDPGAVALAELPELAEPRRVLRYGTAPDATIRMTDIRLTGSGSGFDLVSDGTTLGRIELPVPGIHNARNAAAAAACALAIGAPFAAAAAALRRFAGVARRFEFRGSAGGVDFVDDYAHLPTEVAAAIGAARDGDPDRLVCVFQPHRYSRTASLWREFADAFEGADLLVVTDVYPAGEEPRPGVSGKLIVDAVLDRHPWRRVAYVPRRGDLVAYLRDELRPGDLRLTLGAGDVTSLA
ncbi:MAG: UDP-N-acetylmuramate--L-alanine ligase [Acidimicrobiia bacterium]|nr:UDP-N-acetylmuramate--L-alanine ligase [Acidimicrobiia bacterium]